MCVKAEIYIHKTKKKNYFDENNFLSPVWVRMAAPAAARLEAIFGWWVFRGREKQ